MELVGRLAAVGVEVGAPEEVLRVGDLVRGGVGVGVGGREGYWRGVAEVAYGEVGGRKKHSCGESGVSYCRKCDVAGNVRSVQ